MPRLLLLACCLSLGACSSLGYYGRAVTGHLRILQDREPVQALIQDDETDAGLRQRLILVREILDFAHQRLLLPDNGSYRHYADLNRPYVAWNVFAAPELSLTPRTWCYPLAGCLEYRGFFDRDAAVEYAAKLHDQGWDTHIGGVTAYSTLGWLRDPLLNTMLDRENWEIARLIFHELAHQRIYISDETAINEAFAESVARIGLERWLEARGEDTDRINRILAFEDAFVDLILTYRGKLETLYGSTQPREILLDNKHRLLEQLRRDYEALKQRHGGPERYDSWMARELNNAKLASLATYREWMPEFLALYRYLDEDLGHFYDYMQRIRDCSDIALRQRLHHPVSNPACRTQTP